MAIATYADWEERLLNPNQTLTDRNAIAATQVGRPVSSWLSNPLPGVAPTTAVVPARNILGAIGQENGGGSALRIPGMRVGASKNVTLILCDRLSHQGGLSGTVITAQTTNLPTAALTRYTDGIGVMAGFEIYTTIGTTATTVTASYTNQNGTASGKISPAVPFGATNNRETIRIIPMPMAAGDYGVVSVQSVTVLATTGTAGNFGVTLFKPLLYIAPRGGETGWCDPVLGTLGGGLPEILDGACLFWITMSSNSTGYSIFQTLSFAED